MLAMFLKALKGELCVEGETKLPLDPMNSTKAIRLILFCRCSCEMKKQCIEVKLEGGHNKASQTKDGN